MNEVNNDLLNEFDESHKIETYATFWQRFFAVIIDMLLVGAIIYPISYFNETSIKSRLLFLIFALPVMMYRPILECLYGATIGKMAMKILVVDTSFKRIGLKEALLRNIFGLISSVYYIITTLIIFSSPGFNEITTYKDYGRFSKSIVNTCWGLISYCTIAVIEILCFLSSKQRRALHDRIGQTLVIKRGQK